MFIKQIQTDFNLDEHAYWHDIPAVRALDTLKLTRPVTIFVGENGSGKSTLMEAIAVNYGMNAEGGGKNFNFATRASHSGLCDELILGKLYVPDDTFFLRAEGFYNVATQIEDLDEGLDLLDSYGGISPHEQSHGESFLTLMQSRFRDRGLYLLDEPESATSPMRQMSMLTIMHDLVQRGCQFIMATHSPILMAYPGADVIQLSDGGIQRVNYQDTEHFETMKLFMESPEQLISHLF